MELINNPENALYYDKRKICNLFFDHKKIELMLLECPFHFPPAVETSVNLSFK